MSAVASLSKLPALSVTEPIISWADAVEQETSLDIKNDFKTVTEIVEEDGAKYKVVATYKVVTKKVPRKIAERKKWRKFGASKSDGPGPHVSTTSANDEISMQFIRNTSGEQQNDVVENVSKLAAFSSFIHCRYCKAGDHWSVSCPYKNMYARDGVDDADSKEKDAKTGTGTLGGVGKYVAPGMRGDRTTTAGGSDRRAEENTCRVTNLPEECDEQELRSLFSEAGTVNRVFIAKDKHTNKPKGFAFVTFEHRSQAEIAIQKLNGYKLDHLVLKVEWTRPAN